MRRMKTVVLVLLWVASLAGLALAARHLDVLPADISDADLGATMARMSDELGVSCLHCHASETDLASDAKPQKTTARRMIRLVVALNRDWFDYPEAPLVSCFTCHRGYWRPPPPGVPPTPEPEQPVGPREPEGPKAPPKPKPAKPPPPEPAPPEPAPEVVPPRQPPP